MKRLYLAIFIFCFFFSTITWIPVGAQTGATIRVETDHPYYYANETIKVSFYGTGLTDFYGFQLDYDFGLNQTPSNPPFSLEGSVFPTDSRVVYQNKTTQNIGTLIVTMGSAPAITTQEWVLLATLTFQTSVDIANHQTMFTITDDYANITYQLANLSIKLASSIANPIPYTSTVSHEIPTFDLIRTTQTIEAGIPYTESDLIVAPHLQLIVVGEVNTSQVGVYPIQYQVKTPKNVLSDIKTKTITVVDTTSPQFSIPNQSFRAEEYSEFDWLTLIENLSDNASGKLTKSVVSSSVNFGIPGSYDVTVKVRDGSGNETLVTFQVVILIKQFTVNFYDDDSITILLTQMVDMGSSATAPSSPSKASSAQYHYVFSHWNRDFSNVQSDLSIIAVYQQILREYQITFYDDNQTAILKQETLPFGDTPIPPENPNKASDSYFHYEFASWGEAIVPVTGDKEYIAVFRAIPIVPSVSLLPGIDTIEKDSNWLNGGISLTDTRYEIQIIGNVLTNTLGEYSIEYVIKIDGLLVTSLRRIVTVIPSRIPSIQIQLVPGIDTILVDQTHVNTQVTVPTGASVRVESTVDTSKPGTYLITYYVTYQNQEYVKKRIVTVLPRPATPQSQPLATIPDRRKEQIEL